MPYDTFLTWQIAGDMLPHATKEQILATAFFRNNKYTEEGGVIPEEYRVEYLIDETKTYGRGILGVSIECAQCHDHKYDPFAQKDYYSLLAFFNNTKEVGYEGDVSVSKPAKMPILTISDSDARKMPFLHKTDTGNLMVSVMGERDTLRKTYLLSRGQYDAPTVEVVPNALPAVMPFDTTRFPRNRLGWPPGRPAAKTRSPQGSSSTSFGRSSLEEALSNQPPISACRATSPPTSPCSIGWPPISWTTIGISNTW
jgi:hypothetical protein